jgi:hypothetical protein
MREQMRSFWRTGMARLRRRAMGRRERMRSVARKRPVFD